VAEPTAHRSEGGNRTSDGEAETIVYTDGSCLGNPGPGGWAWAIPGGRYASGAEEPTTNQRMEVLAVVRALEALPGPLRVRSDSAYVVNCFRDRWWEGWRRRGWRNASGKPVANRDLWEPLLALVLDGGRLVRFAKVKGHSGDAMNDWVDALAVDAASSQRGTSGERSLAL
jgi:ribonuclease HI